METSLTQAFADTLVNLSGTIVPGAEAKISVFDRSFLYGDSLYEVARSYDGKLFKLAEHLERLRASAELCRMRLSQSIEDYRREILRTVEAFRARPGQARSDVYCRLIVSRGTGRIGFGLGTLLTPTQFTIIVQPVERFTAKLTPADFEKGLSLAIAARLRNDRRALDPAMKSGNYLNSLLAFLETDSGTSAVDDALLVDSEGSLTEGTTFNIFYARRGILATPPLEVGILDGITRRYVMRLAQDQGVEVREVRFPRERLYEADEAFATSSLKEVFPITRVDGKKIGDGHPGRLTRALAQAYKSGIKNG